MSREKIIGSFTFPSRKAAETEIRRVLHGTDRGTPLEGADLDLIRGLLDCHPDATAKIGCGIASIKVRSIEYGSPGFWITRIDGTGDDFSYRKALDGAPNRNTAIRQAMRHAIRHQVDEYRRAQFAAHADRDGMLRCPLTGLRVRPSGAHVDHIEPFADIALRFINGCGGPNSIPLGSSPHHPGPALADPIQLTAWTIYHRQQARLRVVHASANLARYARKAAA